MKLALLDLVLALVLAPLFPGVINRVKAWFGGRQGKPLLQAYFDIAKLLGKGAVYSKTTTWLFRAGPVIGLAAISTSLLFMPLGGGRAVILFQGDLFLFVSLMALARFFTMAAALDTGSSFEGMGASREATFSALAEPMLILALLVLARQSGSLTLSTMLVSISAQVWLQAAPVLILVSAALFVILLAENCRVPFDDPNTHLELTMIHEVMVLDHSGPDLAFIQYGAALKLWLLGALVVNVLDPVASGNPFLDTPAFLAGMLLLAGAVGAVESIMARLHLLRVPQLLATVGMFSVIALILIERLS
jgi:formate hydrogenlyase subunit 4